MAGPVTMALGRNFFVAHGFGYTDISRAHDTSWAEIATLGRLDSLQWMGPKSDAITITGVLFPREFGGMAVLERITDMALSGEAAVLVSLGSRIFGRFAVQKVAEDRGVHDRLGTPARNQYSIEVRRVSRQLPGIISRLEALI